jgi:hypothetical protein
MTLFTEHNLAHHFLAPAAFDDMIAAAASFWPSQVRDVPVSKGLDIGLA